MSLSKSKCWYSSNCLHVLKCGVPLSSYNIQLILLNVNFGAICQIWLISFWIIFPTIHLVHSRFTNCWKFSPRQLHNYVSKLDSFRAYKFKKTKLIQRQCTTAITVVKMSPLIVLLTSRNFSFRTIFQIWLFLL